MQVVTAWNGMAISAYAQAGRVLAVAGLRRCFPVEGRPPREYLEAGIKVQRALCLYTPAAD